MKTYQCMDFNCRQRAVAKMSHGKLVCGRCYVREQKREDDEPLFF